MNSCQACGKRTFFKIYCGRCFEEKLLWQVYRLSKERNESARRRIIKDAIKENLDDE